MTGSRKVRLLLTKFLDLPSHFMGKQALLDGQSIEWRVLDQDKWILLFPLIIDWLSVLIQRMYLSFVKDLR